jgi:hypothetical protein
MRMMMMMMMMMMMSFSFIVDETFLQTHNLSKIGYSPDSSNLDLHVPHSALSPSIPDVAKRIAAGQVIKHF